MEIELFAVDLTWRAAWGQGRREHTVAWGDSTAGPEPPAASAGSRPRGALAADSTRLVMVSFLSRPELYDRSPTRTMRSRFASEFHFHF